MAATEYFGNEKDIIRIESGAGTGDTDVLTSDGNWWYNETGIFGWSLNDSRTGVSFRGFSFQ